MIISGAIGIRLALSPVAVTSTTCTEDHPYYLSNCDEPDWTATPVTVYPTASENDIPDTDPPIQIPTQAATKTAELTATVVSSPRITSIPTDVSSDNTTTFTQIPTMTMTMTPTPTSLRIVTPITSEQFIENTNTVLECRPHTRLVVKGTTDPYSLLLLTFADRVVGGGISYASGGYAIPLVVGDETRGIYRIEIRQRNTNKVIKQFRCSVP